MSDIFPKWTNKLPLLLTVAFVLVMSSMTAGVWYYFTPKYTRAGYQPMQPVAFSHATHVEQLRVDCRYCHDGVEKSWYSSLPSSATCMNCHLQVLKDDPRLALVRESAQSGRPIPWVQIHKTPDYVHFHHAAHVNQGVSCIVCHGQVNRMEEVQQVQPLSMTFCLDCHRNPAPNLRAPEQVYNLDWKAASPNQQGVEGALLMRDLGLKPRENCSACHR